MSDQVNVGKEHSLGEAELSPRPALAGRELDAAVAEQVFGIKKIFYPRDYKSGNDVWGSVNAPHFIPSGKSPRTHMIDAKPVPHFSTDIAAAMEVVNKLRDSGAWCCVTLKSDYHYVWWVSLTRAEGATSLNPEHKPTLAEQDESLSVAICRAALRAVEVSEPAQEVGTTT